jgi:SAM-dependent methyltransferase
MSPFPLPLTRAQRRRAYLERLPVALATEWARFAPPEVDQDGVTLREVRCRDCPKFAAFPARCRVPFGSRLRSCITASTEAHLHDLRGQRVLEIGCGESSYPRRVLELGGNTWVGIDQRPGKAGKESVRSIAGRVPATPFVDAAFDVVLGVQTLEHWEDVFTPGDCDYPRALQEIWRILRPGGWIYFDGPIHLHGSAPFVRGDLRAIRALFDTQPWTDVRMTAWRREHRPLRPHFAPREETARWREALGETDDAELERLERTPAWILAIRATKPTA